MKPRHILVTLSVIALLTGLGATGPSVIGPLQFGTYLFHGVLWQFILAVTCTAIGGVLSTAIAFTLGIPLGIGRALFLHRTQWVPSLPTDMISSIPRYIFILLLFSIFGKNAAMMVIGCAIAYTPVVTETTRTLLNTHIVNGRYEAFRAHGIGMPRIVFRHILGTLGRTTLIGDFMGGIWVFVIVEASFSYIDPYIYSGLSTTIGMLISRLIHGGHVLSGQAILVFFGVFGLMGLGLTLRRQHNVPK